MAFTLRTSRLALRAPLNPLVLSRQAPRQLPLQLRPPQLSLKRYASTTSSGTGAQPLSRVRTAAFATTLVVGGYLIYLYATDTRASIWRWLVPRVLRTVVPDAEAAHDMSIGSMKTMYSLGLHTRERNSEVVDANLGVTVFGQPISNPIGISAGLDKHADIPDALFALGPSIVEVGGCTPRPQPGNPQPRMFRVTGLEGLINRYGLNSKGADHMAMTLRNRVRLFAKSLGLTEEQVLNGEGNVPPGSLYPGKLLAVQVAKNKETPDGDVLAVARDYADCVSKLAPYADILVVNVSSPNTPGLRDLQAVEPLTQILSMVVEEARKVDRKTKPKVMVKVSPDEDEDTQMEGIVQAVWQSGVDGVIVGNTTKRRNGIIPPGVTITPKEASTLMETGGYSGPMMFDRTLNLVSRYRKMLDGRTLPAAPVVGNSAKAVDDEAVSSSLAGIEGPVAGLLEEDPVVVASQTTAAPHGAGEQKVIFATGGITNGQQALDILNAGASVAMVYTAIVYGGAGTVTRVKKEMGEGIKKA
jgi:dihydroorotate dehydrogenase